MKIKISDNVLIVAGKEKGKTGKVLKILKKNGKIVVEKLNIRTRHIKKTPQKAGEIIHYEAPMAVSNVKIICPNCSKAVRVGYKLLDNAKKQRVCKKCDQSLDRTEVTTKTTRKS
ncbi:50S ribosomal protein L24 [Candidatus Peregrinibacteria bacterium]|nr:50S ribosomal protein L24 [Candidatus Peregrinibacteria bacterium]